MSKNRKILQIIPADGWWARMMKQDPEFQPLACWALIEGEDADGVVMGMIAGECVEFVEDEEKFDAYFHTSELPESFKS